MCLLTILPSLLARPKKNTLRSVTQDHTTVLKSENTKKKSPNRTLWSFFPNEYDDEIQTGYSGPFGTIMHLLFLFLSRHLTWVSFLIYVLRFPNFYFYLFFSFPLIQFNFFVSSDGYTISGQVKIQSMFFFLLLYKFELWKFIASKLQYKNTNHMY